MIGHKYTCPTCYTKDVSENDAINCIARTCAARSYFLGYRKGWDGHKDHRTRLLHNAMRESRASKGVGAAELWGVLAIICVAIAAVVWALARLS